MTLFLDIFLSLTAEMYSAQFECLIAAAHVAVSLEWLEDLKSSNLCSLVAQVFVFWNSPKL